jgi:hypothetical protein
MGRFDPIAGAETALTREFGKHVFEIAERLRVAYTLYNYRVWVVEAEGSEPPTPHQVIEPSLCDAASYITDFPKPEWQAAIEALQ